MGRSSGATFSWLYCILVAFAVCVSLGGFAGFGAVQAIGQASSTPGDMAAVNASTPPATLFGTLYGAAAGRQDGLQRLLPRPSRSPFYANLFQYHPADGSRIDYEQQYRRAFEEAYQRAYEKALHDHGHHVYPRLTPGQLKQSN
jgi:hypothetical protein